MRRVRQRIDRLFHQHVERKEFVWSVQHRCQREDPDDARLTHTSVVCGWFPKGVRPAWSCSLCGQATEGATCD